ncbi:hypothetical protein B0H13DRAFT_1853505 [Mycena leptocephala]|nr:hypothetical protein B0H13DRAFT_1853505 [Mycena leptocephala]
MSRFRPGYEIRTHLREICQYHAPRPLSAVAATISKGSNSAAVTRRERTKTNRMSTGGKPPRMPARPLSILPAFLPAFLGYLSSRERPLSHHTSCDSGPMGLVARTQDGKPIEFTVFGVTEEMDEHSVIELSHPDWDEKGSIGQELGVRFDMQWVVLRNLLEAHGLPYDLAGNNILVKLPDDSYILEVVKVEAMYKNMI